MKFWIFKSEPDVFSFQNLEAMYPKSEPWNGVRNYQVRNMMRDNMKEGDLVLFYHSSCPEPGIAGVAQITSAAKPDPTQFEVEGEYYDPKSTHEQPRWLLVDVQWKKSFSRFVHLADLRTLPDLQELLILRKGNRLSITPLSEKEFLAICAIGS